jgi:elongation factor 1 alpha-like protein
MTATPLNYVDKPDPNDKTTHSRPHFSFSTAIDRTKSANMAPKSGHHRAKNVDYDDDDYYSDDEYFEDDSGAAVPEMTEEDRESMRMGTARVREALDSSVSVTDAQIEEALWHYYYDVGKSVSYLKSKQCLALDDQACVDSADKLLPKSQAQPKAKAISRFDQATEAVRNKVSTGKHTLESTRSAPSPDIFALHLAANFPIHLPTHEFSTCEDFFWDTPWCNVPPHRLGIMTAVRPAGHKGGLKGGLKGGSSKLQALAAKRKQKQEAAKLSENVNSEKAVALLDRLNIKDSKLPTDDGHSKMDTTPVTRYPPRKPSPPPEEPQAQEPEPEPEAIRPAIEFPNLRAQPSMFGAVLCGLAGPTENRHQIETFPSLSLPMPYTTLYAYQEADPFAGPSPDDIVRQAQARGAKRG